MMIICTSGCAKDSVISISKEGTASVSSTSSTTSQTSAEDIVEIPIPEATHVGDFTISGDRLSAVGGAYEQDGDLSNGAEPIEWIVLKDDGDSMILISAKVLDCKPFNTSYADVTWNDSYIRNWLNNDFYQAAFNDSERSIIADYETTKGAAGATDENGNVSAGVPAVTDKVFLLSMEEAKELFGDDTEGDCEARSSEASEYAKGLGVWIIDEEGYSLFGFKDDGLSEKIIGCGNWWLRDNGSKENRIMDVGASGIIRTAGHEAASKQDGIRPAICIRILGGN